MPTSIRLDPHTRAVLTRLAKDLQLNKSEVVREAIAAYGEAESPATPGSPYSRLQHLIGRHPSGRGDLSRDTGERVYRLLRERHERERRRR